MNCSTAAVIPNLMQQFAVYRVLVVASMLMAVPLMVNMATMLPIMTVKMVMIMTMATMNRQPQDVDDDDDAEEGDDDDDDFAQTLCHSGCSVGNDQCQAWSIRILFNIHPYFILQSYL